MSETVVLGFIQQPPMLHFLPSSTQASQIVKALIKLADDLDGPNQTILKAAMESIFSVVAAGDPAIALGVYEGAVKIGSGSLVGVTHDTTIGKVILEFGHNDLASKFTDMLTLIPGANQNLDNNNFQLVDSKIIFDRNLFTSSYPLFCELEVDVLGQYLEDPTN